MNLSDNAPINNPKWWYNEVNNSKVFRYSNSCLYYDLKNFLVDVNVNNKTIPLKDYLVEKGINITNYEKILCISQASFSDMLPCESLRFEDKENNRTFIYLLPFNDNITRNTNLPILCIVQYHLSSNTPLDVISEKLKKYIFEEPREELILTTGMNSFVY